MFITWIFKYFVRFILSISVILLVLAFAPGFPPHEEFLEYDVKPASNYDSKTVDILKHAKLCVEDGKIRRPESIAVKGSNVYLGESGLGTGEDFGKIVKINEKDFSISTVAELGFPCDKLGRSECSSVLGIRFDPNGKLLAADLFGGIVRIDVDTGKVESIISSNEIIDGKKVSFAEDIAVAKDGTIYWSDGSTSFSHKNYYNNVVSAPNGRLLKWDPISKKSTVLIDNVLFANGVELSEDETFVLLSETMKFRILRYYLKGPKKGQKDVFLDALPGIPDNIRSNGKGGFYIPLLGARPVVEINKYPMAMKVVARIIYLVRATIAQIYNFYPHETIRFAYDMAEIVLMMGSPKQALIIEVNENGQVIRALNSTTGNLSFLSQATLSSKYLYLVSPMQDKVWCLEKEKLL